MRLRGEKCNRRMAEEVEGLEVVLFAWAGPQEARQATWPRTGSPTDTGQVNRRF